MNLKFSIVIPTYNKCEEALRPCLESLVKFTDLSETEIIVVANGCTDGTETFVKSIAEAHKNIKLVWFSEAIGYTKAGNEGIKASSGEFIVLLNNDTVLLDQPQNQWLDILVKPFYEDEKIAITGPMKTFSPSAGRDFLIFFCVMISRRALNEIGLMDEIFAPGYGEDTDWTCRAEDMGWKIKQVPENSSLYYGHNRMTGNFPIYHEGNVTFKNWPGGEELLSRNNNILRERYNKSLNIDRALQCDGFMSKEELEWLAERAKECKTIIEVGSWHGRSSAAIGDNLPDGSVLYCIDTWNGSKDEQNTHHASAKFMDGDHAFYEFLQNNFELINDGKIIPIRMSSKNASALLTEKSIKADIIFIDAGHTKDEVIDDIKNWLPLVKEDGTLSGHDYIQVNYMQVKEAVDSMLSPVEHISNTSIWSYKKQKGDLITSKDKSNIFDCFLFNNELDLLERRFQELFEVVDRFVIVEADRTHGSKPKPYYFKDNLKRFEKYLSKVSHVMISDYPAYDSWSIERHQRDCIMRALTSCRDNDSIIISDVDEIPSAEAIKQYDVNDGIMSFEMNLYYYNENCRAKDKWTESKILPYSLLKKLTPCGARYTNANIIPNAGKHMSYFGGIESIKKKIEDTAHQEYNKDEFKDSNRIEKAISEGVDLFGRDLKFEILK